MRPKLPLGLKERLRSASSPEERQQILDGLPYDVGFGKTPTATRWDPGRSGNQRGRPKGSKNMGTIIREELSQKVELVENGKRKKLTKAEVAVRRQVNKALQGDPKAYALIFESLRKSGGLADQNAAPTAPAFDSRDLEAGDNLVKFFEGAEVIEEGND